VVYCLQIFPLKFCFHFLFPHACCMPRASHSPWFNHLNYFWCKTQIMKHLLMHFLPASLYFLPLTFKYSLHPILIHSQSVFLP
jgi:hypothetical protein